MARQAISAPVYANISKGKFGAGFNVAGIGIRYFFLDNYSFEIRNQYEKDIVVAGLRTCRYFSSKMRKIFFIAGLEGDYVWFKEGAAQGYGYMAEFLLGAEYFFKEKLSFQIDGGPTYVYMNDEDTSLSVDGIGFVLDIGVTYYFK